MKRILLTTILASLAALSASSQKKTADDILDRANRNYEAIRDYTVDLEANLDMERVRMPKMKATMYFKAPDKIHFVSPNFAFLPREGFGVPVTTLRRRYDATFKGEEEVKGTPAYKLQLVAKDPASRLQQLMIWIHRENVTLVRMETVPYEGRSVVIDFSYTIEEGRYWLPDSMRVELTEARPDTLAEMADIPVPGGVQLPPRGRVARNGVITVIFSHYRINTGLSDDVFERKEGEER